jgi:hypothetical protein
MRVKRLITDEKIKFVSNLLVKGRGGQINRLLIIGCLLASIEPILTVTNIPIFLSVEHFILIFLSVQFGPD